jgi:hypothetical protein
LAQASHTKEHSLGGAHVVGDVSSVLSFLHEKGEGPQKALIEHSWFFSSYRLLIDRSKEDEPVHLFESSFGFQLSEERTNILLPNVGKHHTSVVIR